MKEKVIFIDRDGVINKDPGGWTKYSYVTNPKELVFLPDSIKALKMLTDAGYRIVLISNQAGVSKGYFTEADLEIVNNMIVEQADKAGAKINKAYYCVHQDKDNCDCRKPKTGLFHRALEELGIKADGQYFIGDGKGDIEAGKKMGLRSVLVLSGKSTRSDVGTWTAPPDLVFNDLLEAVRFIIEHDRDGRCNPND